MSESVRPFLERNQDRPVTLAEISSALGISEEEALSILEKEVANDGHLFEIGDGRFLFSLDKGRVSFEIFRTVAPNITEAEWTEHADNLPHLMYLSRQREITRSNETARKLMGQE